jgi:hypothetical protein
VRARLVGLGGPIHRLYPIHHDVSRNEIQKIRLACRIGGAVTVLVLGALGGMSPPILIALVALVGGLKWFRNFFSIYLQVHSDLGY